MEEKLVKLENSLSKQGGTDLLGDTIYETL